MNNPKVGRRAVASAEARLISGRFQIGGLLAEQSVGENVRHSNIALILGDGIHGNDDASFAWIALEGAASITLAEHVGLTASAALDAVLANDLAEMVVLPIGCDVVNDVSIPPLSPRLSRPVRLRVCRRRRDREPRD